MLKRPAGAMTTGALLIALAGCLPGHPDPSPVGLAFVQGQLAAVVPNCDQEKVVGLTVETAPYDQHGSLKPESEILWQVADLNQPASTGPYIIGDPQPWAIEKKPVTGSLPDSYLVSIETTNRVATSPVERSKVANLTDGQILVDGTPGFLDSLAERWGC